MDDHKICKNCRFFRHTVDDCGKCHFNAPIAGVKDHDKWPFAAAYEFCGQWELNVEVLKKESK